MAATFDSDLCIGCGACTGMCPQEIIEVDDVAKLTDEEACTECGSCVSVCPVEAISL